LIRLVSGKQWDLAEVLPEMRPHRLMRLAIEQMPTVGMGFFFLPHDTPT
jgi:hypothetical protein